MEVDILNMKRNRKPFRLGELFCGPGGLAWGAVNADIGIPGYKIVHSWSNDYDLDTCETYRFNICPNMPQSVYRADIRSFDMKQLSEIDALAYDSMPSKLINNRLVPYIAFSPTLICR